MVVLYTVWNVRISVWEVMAADSFRVAEKLCAKHHYLKLFQQLTVEEQFVLFL